MSHLAFSSRYNIFLSFQQDFFNIFSIGTASICNICKMSKTQVERSKIVSSYRIRFLVINFASHVLLVSYENKKIYMIRIIFKRYLCRRVLETYFLEKLRVVGVVYLSFLLTIIIYRRLSAKMKYKEMDDNEIVLVERIT